MPEREESKYIDKETQEWMNEGKPQRRKQMARIITVTTTLDAATTNLAYISLNDLKKVCSVVRIENKAILGRWGANKAALRKLLEKK